MGDAMDEKITLQNSTLLFSVNESVSTDTVVLFLPGLSGGAFSPRFKNLVDVVLAPGFPIVRVHAWEDATNVESHAWAYYHNVLDEVISNLAERGYVKIIAVGKSFGGGLLLSYQHPSIVKKILWAPAIGIGEDATFDIKMHEKLENVDSFLDLHLNPSHVSADTSAIRIVHGTADTSVPIENSRKIVREARDGKLTEIEDADHSFKSEEEEKELMNATRKFLMELR